MIHEGTFETAFRQPIEHKGFANVTSDFRVSGTFEHDKGSVDMTALRELDSEEAKFLPTPHRIELRPVQPTFRVYIWTMWTLLSVARWAI